MSKFVLSGRKSILININKSVNGINDSYYWCNCYNHVVLVKVRLK